MSSSGVCDRESRGRVGGIEGGREWEGERKSEREGERVSGRKGERNKKRGHAGGGIMNKLV